jgi:hypothetical protein
MSRKRLDDLIKEIGQFYGVRGSFLIEKTDGSEESIDPRRTANQNDSFVEFMKIMMGKSQTAPSSEEIIRQAQSLPEPLPFLITPQSAAAASNGRAHINVKEQAKTLQGSKNSPQEFYTTDQLFFEETSSKPKVTVFQNFSPMNSTATIDTDIVSLYMSLASSLEMSRAVPYLDVQVAGAVSKLKGEAGGGIDQSKNYTFLGRFLTGGGSPSATDLVFYNASTDPDRRNPRFDPVGALEETDRTLTILGGMESFTAPQTMVNADLNYENTRKAVIDQFQPFMSLLSLKLSTVAAGGLMSHKTGNMELMLHDRARMNEIASIIAPDRFGNSRLIVTYGWSHPDGGKVARGGNQEAYTNQTGEIIDAMKITEVFMIVNSKFSFEEGSVKISLSLSSLGGSALTDMDVSLAIGPETRIELVKEQLSRITNLLDELNSQKTANKLTTITVPAFLRNPESIMSINHEQINKSLKDLYKILNNNGSAGSNISQILNELFASNAAVGGPTNSFNKDASGAAIQLVRDFGARLDNYVEQIASTEDPFLPFGSRRTPLDPNKYISLGKLLTCFLGNAFHKQFDDNVDAQLFFHPFNHEAGRLHDLNTSQFYIEKDDLKLILKSQYSPFGKMSFGRLLNIIQQYFVNDLAGPAHGFLDENERSQYVRDPENLTSRTKKTTRRQSNYDELRKKAQETKAAASANPNDQTKKKEAQDAAKALASASSTSYDKQQYENAIEKARSEKLRLFYYGNSEAAAYGPLNFRLPQLSLDVQSIPQRNDWVERAVTDEEANGSSPLLKTVIRVHVIDRACEGMYTASELLISSPGRTFVKTDRNVGSEREGVVYRSNHTGASNAAIVPLENAGFLQKFSITDADLDTEDLLQKMPKEEREKIINYLNANYLYFDATTGYIKDLIRSIYPTLTYGTSATGITKASVSSIEDSSLATIMLVRGGQSDKGSEGESRASTVPMSVMPVSVSLDCIGCPHFNFAQFYFIDFGTNTNIDNVYAVTGLDHTIEPGKFHTSVKMTWKDSFAIFRPLDDAMKHAGLKAILQRLGALKTSLS